MDQRIRDIRKRHGEFLHKTPDTPAILKFIEDARQLGAVLWETDDRWDVQSLMDYWWTHIPLEHRPPHVDLIDQDMDRPDGITWLLRIDEASPIPVSLWPDGEVRIRAARFNRTDIPELIAALRKLYNYRG